jgi:integrase/recombinase XerD
LAAKPGAANNRLKSLKALFTWAIEADQVSRNPARDVKLIRYKSMGHHPWTLEEVQAYELKHPVGTKARLAMALLLYTAGRREDAVRLGRQHIKSGRIRFIQAKNENRQPVEVDIPLHDELARIIEATPSGHMTFLITAFGKPFTPAGFGNRFRHWCDEAGLRHCSAHGLRKALATRLAEEGATDYEIMAWTGHQSLEEVQRYTRTVRRARLADRGLAKLRKGEE